MLQWISDDNNSFQIILRVISKYLIIETNASSDKEKIEAMIGSDRIFEAITKILRNKLENTPSKAFYLTLAVVTCLTKIISKYVGRCSLWLLLMSQI